MGGPTSSYIATSIVFAGVYKYPNETKGDTIKGTGTDNQPLSFSLLHAAAAELARGIVVGQFWN